jgi:hypothetical protein
MKIYKNALNMSTQLPFRRLVFSPVLQLFMRPKVNLYNSASFTQLESEANKHERTISKLNKLAISRTKKTRHQVVRQGESIQKNRSKEWHYSGRALLSKQDNIENGHSPRSETLSRKAMNSKTSF